jgi:hypothetical protein
MIVYVVDGFRYPSMYVTTQFMRFVQRFSASSILSHLDVDQFIRLHEQLLGRLTKMETQIAKSTQLIDDTQVTRVKEKNNDPLRRLIVHHRYEKALKYFKREFHQVWKKTFNQTTTAVDDVRVIVGTLLNRSLSSLLVRKCPPLSMLR